MSRHHIVLVGMAGTGKSTVGRLVAGKLGWSFADSDERIVEREGVPIPTIFAEQGEAYFREVEGQVLEELLHEERRVIATGGGAVLAERNRQLMLEGGLVVALRASAETIIARVSGDRNRPLLKGNPAVEVPLLLERRKLAYAFAPVQLETDGRHAEAIADELVERWEAWSASSAQS